MTRIIKQTAGHPSMAVLSEQDIELLDRCIRLIDRNLELDSIDYSAGTVSVAITYNRGTGNEWVKHDFIQVNVACDSIPAIFRDVYGQVYDRCMH